MSQINSYYLYKKYEKRGNQPWLPVFPNVWSVDGDGTKPLVIKESADPECNTQYRWVNSGTTCVGVDKYNRSVKEVSYDNGETWSVVTPLEESATTLVETNSEDCGYRARVLSGTPYCDGDNLVVETSAQTSSDSGQTWTTGGSGIPSTWTVQDYTS